MDWTEPKSSDGDPSPVGWVFAVVDGGVVFAAEEDQVDEGGDTTVGPVDDVVGVAP